MMFPIKGTISDIGGGEAWGAEKLRAEISRRAAEFAVQGLGRGDRFMILHGGTPAFFADLFAVWSIGGVAACLNPNSAKEEVVRVSEFVGAKAVCVAGGGEAPADLGLPVFDGASAAAASPPSAPLGNLLDDAALILFTSGTTGEPKGVVHTFRSLLSRLALNVTYIGEEALQRTLCTLPTHFGHGLIGNCLSAIYAGGDLSLLPAGNLKLVGRLGEIVDERGIRFMSSVPSFWKMALKLSKRPSGGSLRRINIGSAPLSADLWQAVIDWTGDADVANMYGITETANWICGARSSEFEPEDGLIGRMWGGSIGVLTEEGERATHGHGELIVQSPSLMHGYFQRADLNEAALFAGWYRTGDVGEVTKDGVARLTGRRKYEINRAGLKVHPEDIDLLLERHEGVREACAFGLPDEIAGETVGVAVSVVDPEAFDLAELKRWCAERLAREKTPQRWFVLAEIPKTDRGKINRDTVAAAALASEAS
ncbi:MAG: class I adenylate-forming enzyme family protein [Marivibrio sp.]|uniref:class I adenylate-forming enzyme family protein n=1 Tax=Marivibrio sp. TaxID=2039719 RepID=UPI0032EECEC2